ncbi:XRE family transcriptional regulator [Streptomyces sp. ISL-12]|uniref:helix-turn-helix domain-containing protein n=1 Tax=Streptomyces sp. ISL-12 TaxID=2819177 RepID=UPI001BECDD97|nr:XRE family transcriptional regulator [Streptomyces sp. ISL-12]MBT2415130.1 XRE family transcriptional regulator [Streptomyces sp. ISL-12]
MPRWKALPDELDPQIKEFAGQLRRLVDRSELSIAAVADATGYSKTSWERYLNGRLLAPKGAIVALAEVTGTNPVHLTTMWELAERAWSRSEMRHDMTMEAIRISQARAALGELTAPQQQARSGRGTTEAAGVKAAAEAKGGAGAKSGRAVGRGVLTPGIAGPAGVAPTVPPVPAQPTAADSQDWAGDRGGVRGGVARDAGARDGDAAAEVSGASSGVSSGASSGGNSWGMAGYRGPAPSGNRRATPPGESGPDATVALGTFGSARPAGTQPQGGPPPGDHGPGQGSGSGGKRLTTFVAGVVGVLVVVAGAFFLLNDGGEKEADARPSPSPTVSTGPELPAGVKCSGDQCTGKDAETMGCGGDLVTTERTATVGTAVVEVRYSKTCGTAWGRVTQAGQGDEVEVSAGGAEQTGSITVAGDTIAYTPMVAVDSAADAKACVTLASGEKGCTE